MPWINMVYEYDDSYEGFLCCIYESYVNKEFPIAFFSNEEFSVLTLYPVRCVKTDLTHSFPLYKAVRHLSGELEKLRGFVRFSDFGGILGAEIEPKNRVLPFLRGYFCSRYANEPFFLYDRTHGELLLYCGGRSRIMQVDSITLAPPDAQEAQYRKLWKTFFDTVAIEDRYNPRCQNTFLPKRYRCTMTEFQSESSFTPEASRADVLPPSVPDEISAPATLPGYALSAPGSCI